MTLSPLRTPLEVPQDTKREVEPTLTWALYQCFFKDLQNGLKKRTASRFENGLKKTKNPENPCYFKRIPQISKMDKKTLHPTIT
mgnify:CR=1 FL=1